MKKYILYTNTKEKCHVHSIEFSEFYLLFKYLQENFYFETWDIKKVIEDFYEFMRDTRDVGIYDLTINNFILKHFGLLNCYDFDIDLFDDFCEGKLILISTFCDWRFSYFLSLQDLNDESNFAINVLNELLEKHGTTTTPMGVLPIYEIVVEDDYIEGQLELITGDDLPF